MRRAVTMVVLAALIGTVPAWAQEPELVNVEVEPITCWWRSSTSAVRSGEPFWLTLTCQVVETQSTTVVPDQSKLDASVVQLEPFEVIGGSHAPDMRVPGKRFFQYEYQLRLINEGAFGADVDVPELQLTYRIESQVGRGEAVQGRDLTYNLRPISIRLMSIVPEDTMDIREAPATAFQAVEARESRADLLRLVGAILFGLAGVVLLVMLVNLVRSRRVRTTVDSWQVTPRGIAAAVTRELTEVRQQSRGGWDADLAGRALAAARLAATLVSARPVAQRRATRGTRPVDGQLVIEGWLGRSGAFVSGSATPQSATDAAVSGSLLTLTRLRYGRGAAFDSGHLDQALDTALETARRAASEHSWLSELLKRRTRD
ncbi:MAG TPA: hypothetical protein PLH72_08655 [Vicinamibacterales bacterium]|nr:hypothetical protein [Vicinamibacterales bacterium]